MIRKIISSGEPGGAMAALEAAVKLGLSAGGWTAESDPGARKDLVERFGLKVLETGGRQEADRLNLLEADATLLLTRGETDPRREQVRRLCETNEKPFLHLDPKTIGAFQASRELAQWIAELNAQVLHVTGSDASREPEMARIAQDLLEAFFYLHLMPDWAVSGIPAPEAMEKGIPPQTVSEAVAQLKEHLPLKDKTTIANMSTPELESLDAHLGEYIRNRFQLYTGNNALLESCRWTSGQAEFEQENAAAVIIHELWRELKKTHTLRIIK